MDRGLFQAGQRRFHSFAVDNKELRFARTEPGVVGTTFPSLRETGVFRHKTGPVKLRSLLS